MAKYMQDSTDIQINEVSGTDNINFTFKNGNSLQQEINNINTNIGNLNDLQTTDKTNLVGAINSVVESGNVGTKKYIKYADGTMICSNTVNYSNISITTTWGSFFESGILSLGGNYPVAFVDEPDLIVTSHYPNFVEKYGNASSTDPGTFYATKPRSATGENVKVSYIAIGRWK